MYQPVSPYQRQPLPVPGALRRDTPQPLPEPQIWAAIAAVAAFFAFMGLVLPWFLPAPSGSLYARIPVQLAPLAVLAATSSWVLAAPTMRRRGALIVALLNIAAAVAGLVFAVAMWVIYQVDLANDPNVPFDVHGRPLLGMWMFLIGAAIALGMGLAALGRLRRRRSSEPRAIGLRRQYR